MKIKSLVLVCVLAVASVGGAIVNTGCGQVVKKYDNLVDKDEACNKAWSDVDAQLQRRYDLIPNMVSIVKGSAAHEEQVLREVTEARASATQIKMTEEDFTDPAKMAAFQKAQDQLKGSLSRLMMVQEKYPDLQANQQFHDLMTTLEGTENRILQARRVYNDAVAEYNKELRHVSGKAINPLTGHEFKPRQFYQADAGATTAPKIDFSPTPAPSK